MNRHMNSSWRMLWLECWNAVGLHRPNNAMHTPQWHRHRTCPVGSALQVWCLIFLFLTVFLKLWTLLCLWLPLDRDLSHALWFLISVPCFFFFFSHFLLSLIFLLCLLLIESLFPDQFPSHLICWRASIWVVVSGTCTVTAFVTCFNPFSIRPLI